MNAAVARITISKVSAITLVLAASLVFACACRGDEAADRRADLGRMLGMPALGGELHAEARGTIEWDGIVIEKWIYTAEPGSRVPLLFYRPKNATGKLPVVVFTYGHGSSKSSWSYHYAGMLYAKLGLAAVAIDPIGEEERNLTGKMGSRAHDNKLADERAAKAGRLMMGKLIFDTMRAVDWATTRDDVDADRIAVAGYSLGGATASWMAALDSRLHAALVCGWAYDDIVLPTKLCTSVSFGRMRERMNWPEFIGLAAPRCAILTANGDLDVVIDRSDREVWARSATNLQAAEKWYGERGKTMLQSYLEHEGGHRPYYLYKEALLFLHDQLGPLGMSREAIRGLPEINAGRWCDRYQIGLEKLYGTELHWRGATLPDLKIVPLAPNDLSVLRKEELGSPDFTLEGWLDRIEKRE